MYLMSTSLLVQMLERTGAGALIRFAAFVLLILAGFAQTATAAELAADKALIDAVYHIDLEGVRTALARGANPNVRRVERSQFGGINITPVLLEVIFAQPRNSGLLQASADNGELVVGQGIAQTRTEIAKELFDAGATLARLDDLSRSILWTTSIRTGNVSLVRLLIDHGQSVTKKVFPEDVTPAELALMEGRQGAYELLISRGASPVADASSAQFALIASAERSDLVGMEAAIKAGAQINKVADDQTALMVALSGYICTEAQLRAIKWLLDHGADPNAGSKFDLPLHRFVFASSFTLNEISTLREEDLRAIRQSAETEFDAERVRALNKEVLTRVLKAGAKLSTLNNYGWTPLHYAARYNNLMAAKILMMEGAKVSQRDPNYKAPIDYAVTPAMISLLKSNGITEQEN